MLNYDKAKRVQIVLEAIHPKLFSLENPVPFKIGLYTDTAERYPEISRKTLKILFHWLTIRRAYLRACTDGADRIGFDGVDGEVTPEQAKYAAERLIWREADVARREAERLARIAAQ